MELSSNLDAVDLLRLPAPQCEQVVVERTASVGTDVEVSAMLLYLTDDFLRAGATIGPESIYTDVPGFQKSEEPPMRVCLMKSYVCIAVAVLDIDDLVSDNINSRSVAEKFLARRFCIILLCLNELMVKVNIVFLNFLQLTSRNQGVDKQCVEFARCVEIIGLALVGSIGDVILCQFPDGSEDGIRTACAQGWMIREMAHQMRCHILRHEPPQKYTLIRERTISLN